jgi:hypothetical protein
MRTCSVTLEVILRAVFGVTDRERRERLADQLGRLLAQTASAGLQFAVLLSRRFGAPDSLARLQGLAALAATPRSLRPAARA